MEALKRQVDIPATIKDALTEQGIGEEFFMSHVEDMADRAFDDQCTGTNPRYPLIADLKQFDGTGILHLRIKGGATCHPSESNIE